LALIVVSIYLSEFAKVTHSNPLVFFLEYKRQDVSDQLCVQLISVDVDHGYIDFMKSMQAIAPVLNCSSIDDLIILPISFGSGI